jgi:hypothetical protein
VLYCATHQCTAVAEVRPWKGALVSVALLELRRSLRVVNCTIGPHDKDTVVYFGEPAPHKREARVWRDIDRAFSQPVTGAEDEAEYVPTQILAERFRHHGYCGIAYGSSVGEGHNLAIFNPDDAKVVGRGLVRVRHLTISCEDEEPLEPEADYVSPSPEPSDS